MPPSLRYDAERHHRRSARLPGVDYAGAGIYFVTICTWGQVCLFGEVAEGVMRVNGCGEIVTEEWVRTGEVRENVVLDAFVVMPNHVHGIIGIMADGSSNESVSPGDRQGCRVMARGRGTPPVCPYGRTFGGADKGSISTIMRQFKSVVTKRINAVRGTPGEKVWQRNYYEHIVRNERDLDRIRRYIAENPGRWDADRYNDGFG